MKKCTLTFCLLLITAAAAIAQSVPGLTARSSSPISKGTWMIGPDLALANFSFGSAGHGDNYTTYTIGLHPKVAYFITDHLAVGAGSGADITRTPYYTNNLYELTPFARYYFGKVKADHPLKTRFFLEAGLGASWLRYRYPNDLDNSWQSSGVQHNAYIMPGASFFLNKAVSLDLGVYYQHYGARNQPSTQTIGASLGFRFFLGGKKR